MKYDIIIAGGGTAGCACAYTAGKLGLKVLLIEKNSFLGGTMTSGLVTPAMNIGVKNKINNTFFETLMKKLHDIGGQITYPDGNIGWFNPELMKITLDDMMAESDVEVFFNTSIKEIVRDKHGIKGVILNNENTNYIDTIDNDNTQFKNKILSLYIETKYLVDGTGDAKIFENLNLEFLNKNNFDSKIFQPVNLRFIMSSVDIKSFSDWIMNLDSDRQVTTSYTIDGQIHLSTAYTWDKDKNWALAPVFQAGIEEELITDEDSNYFQIFTIPGMPDSIAFNCPRVVGDVNIFNKVDYSNALIEARKSILRLSKFLNKKFTGFKDAYISSIANSLGVRVSNRIKGRYVYTIDDLKSGKKFENPCLISDYPIDVHSTKDGESILEKQNIEYMLPIESLMSDKYENLFAIGRCISADFYAQAALRIIPACFSMGEGLAKYISKNLQ